MNLNSNTLVEIFKKPDLILSLNAAQLSKLVIVLRQQKVLARYAYFFQQAGVLNELHVGGKRHMLNALKIAQKQREQVETESQELTELLNPHSEFVVFLKGAAYSLSDSKVGKGRVYSDIDVLVNKSQIDKCEETLVIHGWFGQEINDYDDKYYRKWAHEIPPMAHMKRGTVIDVHHNIIPIISNDAPTVELLSQHIVKTDKGISVLSAPAQFVHSAVHLFRNEDYKNAFRDLLDLYLMIDDKEDSFLQTVVDTARHLGFSYEVGLAFDALHTTLGLDSTSKYVDALLKKSKLRLAVDRFIFSAVLLPQHSLLQGSKTPAKQFLAIIRGHFIKMPLHLLAYHLLVKAGRSTIEAMLGKHFFTPKDEESEQQKF